jgi:hypothetical protein
VKSSLGRQIQLYLTPSDLVRHEAVLREKVEFVALHYRSDGPYPSMAPSFEVEEMGNTWLTLFLVRPDDIDALQFREVPAQKYWTVDVLNDPVIEFSRPYFDGSLMRRGRLYYQPGFYNKDDAWVEKPKAYLEWADRIFRATRKVLHRDSSLDAYCGPESLALYAEKKIECVTM